MSLLNSYLGHLVKEGGLPSILKNPMMAGTAAGGLGGAGIGAMTAPAGEKGRGALTGGVTGAAMGAMMGGLSGPAPEKMKAMGQAELVEQLAKMNWLERVKWMRGL